MNNCTFTGRIGSDPEVKKTNGGKSVLQINLAVKRNKDTTDWIPVVLWDQSAEFLGQYAGKGDLIEVIGKLQSRQYESNGQKRTVLEVHASQTAILSHSDKRQTTGGGNPAPAQDNGWSKAVEVDDNDLPF